MSTLVRPAHCIKTSKLMIHCHNMQNRFRVCLPAPCNHMHSKCIVCLCSKNNKQLHRRCCLLESDTQGCCGC